MTGRQLKTLIMCIIFMAAALSVDAQDITVTTQVGATSVPVNGRLSMLVTVSGSDANKAGEPQFDPMPSFTIRLSGTSSSIEIVNFATSVSVTYTYILTPSEIGTFDVGAAYVTVDNKRFSSTPISIRVTDAQSAPPAQSPSGSVSAAQGNGDDDLFVTGSVDKKTVYVGEQITYSFELYNRRTISDTEYEPPETTGFWTADLPNPPATIKVRGNFQYNYNLLQTALFPTTAGTLTIGPAAISYEPRLSFFSTGPRQRIATDPIQIEVKPLPSQGRPDGFTGAVGSFRISAQTAQDTVRAGDIVTITVSVTGDGNLDLITGLGEPNLNDFRTYPSRVTDTIRNSGTTIGGIKIWEYMISPRQQGSVIIQPFTITYFDPVDGTYHISETKSLTVTVLPGAPAQPGGSAPVAPQSGMTSVASDIRYLKPDHTLLKSVRKGGSLSWVYILAHLIPAGVFIAMVFYKRRRDTIEMNTGLRRKLNAWKHAQQRLKHARACADADDAAGFCGALHDSVTAFIGDMLNIDTGALTVSGLEGTLRDHGVPAENAAQIRKTLEMCDFVRFASIGSGNELRDSLLSDTAGHLSKLRELL